VTPVGTPRVPWHRAGGDPPAEDTGFDSVASTSGGNQLTVDEERCKLELVASTASTIWA
jgi:hypothetical protein